MSYSQEFLSQIKELIKNKLIELNALADEELPDYIAVMVANKKKLSSMKKDLQLFLGDDTDRFTEWLHNVIDSKSQEKIRKEKPKRSSHRSGACSGKARSEESRPAVIPRKPSSEVTTTEDCVNVQTDESNSKSLSSCIVLDEFMDEFSTENKSDSKPKEQRRVVTTSSLKDSDGHTRIEEKPTVSTENASSMPPSTALAKSDLPSAGGKLLKRAMNDVKNNAALNQAKQNTSRELKRSFDSRRDVVSKPQSASPLDSDGSEIPQKMTKFVVTMNDEALTGLKPSVKSRLGPRVPHNSDILPNSAGMVDAREILIARKTGLTMSTDEGRENGANKTVNLAMLDVKKSDRSSVPSSLQRCKYWPNCRNQESCEFFHPKEECKSFPNCRYGVRCLYIHPLCRYGAQCSRPDCPFSHNVQAEAASSPLTAKIVCRYYPHCKMPPGACPFFHPPTPVCRFGGACLNRTTTCPFVHPAASISAAHFVPPKKLKWVAPGRCHGNSASQKQGSVVAEAPSVIANVNNGPALVQSTTSARIIST